MCEAVGCEFIIMREWTFETSRGARPRPLIGITLGRTGLTKGYQPMLCEGRQSDAYEEPAAVFRRNPFRIALGLFIAILATWWTSSNFPQLMGFPLVLSAVLCWRLTIWVRSRVLPSPNGFIVHRSGRVEAFLWFRVTEIH